MLKISTALFFVCVLTACDMFFKPKSIFASLDRPDVQAVSELKGDALLTSMLANKGSRVFYSLMTTEQSYRIIVSLDEIITEYYGANPYNPGGSFPSSAPALGSAAACRVFLAAQAKADVLVHTSSLAYSVINNMADPLFNPDNYTRPNAGEMLLYDTLAMPLVDSVEKDRVQEVIVFLVNMYGVSDSYYFMGQYASERALDGGDLQVSAVSTLFAAVINSVLSVAGSSAADIQAVAEAIVQVYQESVVDGKTLTFQEFLQKLSGKVHIDFGDITDAFNAVIDNRVSILEKVADCAGFETTGRALGEMMKFVRDGA